MSKILNISKDYLIDKPLEESFERFNAIISTPFNNSKFSTFGNLVSANPPEFLFMAKWVSFGRPLFANINSTKIFAKLLREGNRTKIVIKTQTNPMLLIFFFLVLIMPIIRLLTYNNLEDFKLAAIYFLIAILILGFDRFIKNILIGSFEKDVLSK
jgi:hypothetical protein